MDTLYLYAAKFAEEFLSLILITLPWFVLGAMMGALLEKYLSPAFAQKYLSRGFSSIVSASIFGAVLPGCSCATVPMANGLKQSGSSLAVITSFIMVSPLLSPHTLILNYGLLGWEFTVARIVFSMAGAILLGIMIQLLTARKIEGFVLPEQIPVTADSCGCDDNCGCDMGSNASLWRSLWNNIKSLGKYFLIGIALASVLTTFIPEEAIPEYLGTSGPFTYLAAIGVGLPLYVCEGEEIPITLALTELGFGPGPAFAFLLGSVGTCIPTLMMAPKVIGRRPTIFYFGYWLIFALASGLLFNLFM